MREGRQRMFEEHSAFGCGAAWGAIPGAHGAAIGNNVGKLNNNDRSNSLDKILVSRLAHPQWNGFYFQRLHYGY